LCANWADGVAQEGVDQYKSGDARVTIEYFAPTARGKFPVVLLLHGSGGLDPGTADVFRAIGRDFAEKGYVVLIPHYFERTGHAVGQPFQAKEFMSWIEAVQDAIEFGVASGIVDADRIGMIGYSMGAHIAFYRGARDPRIKAIVSCAGDLPVESKSKFPPVLILQGSEDRSNPLPQVKKFQEVLKANGTPYANHIYKGMGHNFDVDRWSDAARRAAAFFDKHMKTGKDARPKKSQRGRLRKGLDRGSAPRKERAAEGPAPGLGARKTGGVG
jgi:carboxymethylenebutenolidase